MKPSLYLKYIALIGISFLAISQAISQSTWYNYNFDKLDEKYHYSTDRLDATQMKINTINFLSFQTKYLLDSCYRLNTQNNRESFSADYLNFNKMLAYAATSNNLDSVESILDFLSFEVTSKYLETATDSLIEVSVKVIRDSTNEELSGYNVFAKPAMSIDRADVISFNPTKNAIKKLRPGKKTFWIERNGVKIKEQKGWGVSISDRNSHLVIFNVNN